MADGSAEAKVVEGPWQAEVNWQAHLEAEWFRWVVDMGMDPVERARAEACVGQLEPDAFTGYRMGAFRMVKSIIDEGDWPCLAEVMRRTRAPGSLERIGGDEALDQLFAGRLPTGWMPHNVCLGIEPITRWLREEWELRRQGTVLASAQVALREGRRDDVEAILDALHDYDTPSEDDLTAQDLVRLELMRLLEGPKATKPDIRSGLDALDDAIEWNPGDLIFFAGSTGAGKTATMLAVFDGFARRGIRSGYISLEDGVDVLAPRQTSLVTGIPKRTFRHKTIAQLSSDVAAKIESAAREERLLRPVHTIRKNATLAEVRRIMTRHVRKHGVRILAVDYVHAIKSKVKGSDRRHELASFAAELKAHSDRLGVPLILGAQLKRLEKGEVPTKRDLRDCGELEEKAEGVFIAWETPPRVQDGHTVVSRVLVAAKVKNGSAGYWLEMNWDRGTLREEPSGRRALRRMRDRKDFEYPGENPDDRDEDIGEFSDGGER